jgi:hypothetical protein
MFMILAALSLQSFGANGAISGRVTDLPGNGLYNVRVYIYVAEQTANIHSARTDSDGYYTISDLAPGSYKVLFEATDNNPAGYIWEYYNDKHTYSDADVVVVNSGETTTGISAAVASIPTDPYKPNGDLASAYTVTTGIYDNIVANSASTGTTNWFKIYLNEGQDLRVATLNPIEIFPNPATPLDIDMSLYDGAGNVLAQAESNRAIETLYLSNVTAGWYYISIVYAPDCVLSLSITAGDLEIGEITGHITNSLGAGVQGIRAGIHTWNNLDWSLFQAYVQTDASGNYKFASTPGSFRIYFDNSESLDPYVMGEWYNNQPTSATSAVVSIAAGQTTSGIDAQLADGAAISGRLADLNDDPLANGYVYAYDSQGTYAYTLTNSSGNYIIKGIPIGDGTRKVRFRAGSGYAGEWWNDKTSFGVADNVSIQARQTATGINAQLASGGRITGRVTDSLGSGLGSVTVWAYDTVQNLVPLGNAVTNGTGNYTIYRLPTMSARIFFDTGRASAYNSAYYTDKLTFASADAVAVTAGSVTSGIDAQLSTRSVTIREPDGGERWCGGSVHALEWTNTGTIANVKIEYSLDNGRNFITAVASTPNTGRYQWTVPAIYSTTCVIRISDASNPADYDDSNSNITITSNRCRVSGDFNRDGLSDASVWRPSNGVWYTIMDYDAGAYASIPWGLSTDIVVPGDYDGDGQSDIAAFRPDTGVWYVLPSGTPGSYTGTQWGLQTDIPMPADYDGDGKADIAVFRPNTGIWYILLSGTPGVYTATGWGMNGDIPIPADYDGDGKADIAVWRQSSGVWYILSSAVPGTYTSYLWGGSSDIPVPGDYDGDFKIDIAVWRPGSGVWYILPSASLTGTYTNTAWGLPGDKPAVGDYDGDGKYDITIWRPDIGTYFVLLSSTPGTYVSAQWGMLNDQPISLLTRIVAQFP